MSTISDQFKKEVHTIHGWLNFSEKVFLLFVNCAQMNYSPSGYRSAAFKVLSRSLYIIGVLNFNYIGEIILCRDDLSA